MRKRQRMRELRLRASRKYPIKNGPVDCRLLRYEIGARRDRPDGGGGAE